MRCSMKWAEEGVGGMHTFELNVQMFGVSVSFLRETDVMWRILSKSEGLHHLADLGKHLIW